MKRRGGREKEKPDRNSKIATATAAAKTISCGMQLKTIECKDNFC